MNLPEKEIHCSVRENSEATSARQYCLQRSDCLPNSGLASSSLNCFSPRQSWSSVGQWLKVEGSEIVCGKTQNWICFPFARETRSEMRPFLFLFCGEHRNLNTLRPLWQPLKLFNDATIAEENHVILSWHFSKPQSTCSLAPRWEQKNMSQWMCFFSCGKANNQRGAKRRVWLISIATTVKKHIHCLKLRELFQEK